MLTAPARCSQVADTAADQAIPPAELLATAQQAHAHITMTPGAPHLSMTSNPGLVTKVILEAIKSTA